MVALVLDDFSIFDQYEIKKIDFQKFEYFHPRLIKWVDFFVDDIGVFKIFLHKKNVKKYHFEARWLVSLRSYTHFSESLEID